MFFILFFILFILFIKANKQLKTIIIISSIILFSALLLFQIELLFNSNMTYGSDATFYKEVVNKLFNNYGFLEGLKKAYQQTNGLYLAYSLFSLYTSLFRSILVIKINNILLYIINIIMLYKIIISIKKIKFIKEIMYFYLFTLNGIAIYMTIRNLKDILFLTLIISFIYISIKIYYKFPKIIFIFSYFLLTYFLSIIIIKVRPWGNYLLILVGGLVLLKTFLDLLPFKTNILFFAILILGSLLLYNRYYHLINYLGNYSDNFINRDMLSLYNILNGSLTFFLGPGPLRNILGNQFSKYPTIMGDFLKFIGSSVWLFFLPTIVLDIIKNKNKLLNNVFILKTFVIVSLYSGVYILSYGGSVDTRLRSITYLLSFLLWIIIKKDNSKVNNLLGFILVIIVALININQYLSLY